jgi:DNA-binding NtrC family response regulator
VESGPEAGTTFSIYFPKKSSKLLPVVKQKTNIDQTGDETILLIDDENSILEVIQPLLERYGYTVLTTTMPSKALSYLNDPTKNIDLVITDVIMPEMNGQELHNKMLEINPNIKCLFMSGYTDDLISKKTLAEKNVYFVQKPISAKNLASKIREILDSE